jgi:hypothetical protein
VIDTNVATTANRANEGASTECATASALALQAVMREGHVFIDAGYRILKEYIANLRTKGEPREGSQFLKWLLTMQGVAERVTHVTITPRAGDCDDFEELPPPPEGVVYDPSDRKFLAVAAAHEEHPPILQSFDSKWCGWVDALKDIGVEIHFLCPEEIRKKYQEKRRR